MAGEFGMDLPQRMEELLLSLPFERLQGIAGYYLVSSQMAKDKETLIHNILRQATSVNAMKDMGRSLGSKARKFMEEAIALFGLVKVDYAHKITDTSTIQSLSKKGLLFSHPDQRPEVYIIPLEVCIGIPKDELEPKSLLRAFYYYPADMVKRMARTLDRQYLQMNKLQLASTIYLDFIKQLPAFYRGLSEVERLILRTVFEYGRPMDVNELRSTPGLKHMTDGERYYSSWEDPVFAHFTPYSRRDKEISQVTKAAISLITKGLLAFKLDQYSSSGPFFVPNEVLPLIEEEYLKEREAITKGLESRLLAEPPPTYKSYASQILFDIIRTQIAIIGRDIRLTAQGEICDRSLLEMAKLLDRPEDYLRSILYSLKTLKRSDDKRFVLKKIETDTLGLLREAIFESALNGTLARILARWEGWLHLETLMAYLLNHNELFRYRTQLKAESLKGILQSFFLFGLIERGGEGDEVAIRVTPILHDLLAGKRQPATEVLVAKEKPLVIQPNMEILLPYNTEPKIINRLSLMANMTVIDRMIHMAITKDSIMKAYDHRLEPEEIKEFLSSLSKTPLPKVVEEFIGGLKEKKGEAVIIPCTGVIIIKGMTLAGKISGLKGLGIERVEGREDILLIKDTNPEKVLSALKKSGIFADMANKDVLGKSTKPSEIKALLHHAYHDDTPITLTCLFKEVPQDITVWIEDIERDYVRVYDPERNRTRKIPMERIKAAKKVEDDFQ
ncbi:TPA: hypothetical protein DCX15_04435 [bacterium]|nr:hypothetical protein [bacterium]